MSGTFRSAAMRTLDAKCRDTERQLACHFIAFVRTPQASGEVGGYIVYATSGDLGVYGHENFSFMYIVPPGVQFKETHTILESGEQAVRRCYSSEDFYSLTALNLLGGYARYVLEDWREPRALPVCAVVLDCSQRLYTLDYRGSADSDRTNAGGTKIFLVGCYDEKVKKEIRRTLRNRLIIQKPTKASCKRMLAEIRSLTGLRRISYFPVTL